MLKTTLNIHLQLSMVRCVFSSWSVEVTFSSDWEVAKCTMVVTHGENDLSAFAFLDTGVHDKHRSSCFPLGVSHHYTKSQLAQQNTGENMCPIIDNFGMFSDSDSHLRRSIHA